MGLTGTKLKQKNYTVTCMEQGSVQCQLLGHGPALPQKMSFVPFADKLGLANCSYDAISVGVVLLGVPTDPQSTGCLPMKQLIKLTWPYFTL